MKAIILTGGLGKRLRPFTFAIPKPLIPLGDKPILQIIIEHLKKFHISDLIFATGWHSELIETYFGKGEKFGIKIAYVKESKPLGTAGPLSLAKNLLVDQEPFLLMNGDVVTKININKLLAYHNKNNFDLTIGTAEYKQRLPFGTIIVKNKRVEQFIEKPLTSWKISTGIYLLNKDIVDFIPKNKFFSMPSLIKKLITNKRSVGVYAIKEYWAAVENIAQLEEINKNLRKNKDG